MRSFFLALVMFVVALTAQGTRQSHASGQPMIAATCDAASQKCFFFDNSNPNYKSRVKQSDVVELSRNLCSKNAFGCQSQHSCHRMPNARFMVVGLDRRSSEFSSYCSDTFTDAQKSAARLIGMCVDTGTRPRDCVYFATEWGRGPAQIDIVRFRPALNTQYILKQSGFYSGPIDGGFGPVSREALRQFMARYGDPTHSGELDAKSQAAIDRFEADGGFPVVKVAPPTPPNPEPTKPLTLQLIGSGTGFFVHTTGVLVTNNHVVDECDEIKLQSGEILQLLSKDAENDLAALKANAAVHTLNLDASIAPLGSNVFPAGFPVPEALESEFNFTSGIVTAASGQGATSLFQINAEVQPGNSGGPVLNDSGNVVGVVVSRLEKSDPKTMLQNVNFAIRSGTLAQFLGVRSIPFEVGDSRVKLGTVEIAAVAKKATELVLCYAVR